MDDIVFTNNSPDIQYLYAQPILLKKQVNIAQRHGWTHEDRTRFRYSQAREFRMPAEQDMVNGKLIWKKGKVIIYIGSYEDRYINKNTNGVIVCSASYNPFPYQCDLYEKKLN